MKALLAALVAMALPTACAVPTDDEPAADEPREFSEDPEPSRVLKPGATIDVLSWNIQKKADAKPWQRDMSRSYCMRRPDIILLQEAVVSDQGGLESVLVARDMQWKFVPNVQVGNGTAGVVTAAQVSPLKVEGHLSSAKEPVLSTPKAAVFTAYEVEADGRRRRLLVANVHGINFNAFAFRDHMDEIFAILARYAADHAIILAGDFNTWSSERLDILTRHAESVNLARVPIEDATAVARPWRWLSFVHDKPLDHIFYSRDHLQLVSYEALSCTTASDHKPLHAAFSFSGPD